MAATQRPPLEPSSSYFLPNNSRAPLWSPRTIENPNYTPAAEPWTPDASKWTHMRHPIEKEVTAEVDGYFLDNWNFDSEKARKVFVLAGFSEVTCLYFPLAKNDRITYACRLLTVLFLIDDLLEDMSFADGEAYNAKLMPIARGEVLPDRTVPAEFITYDLWESMRAKDKELADEVLEPTFTFMRAQTDRSRTSMKELGEYLEYRERDVGKALLSALMRFSMDLHIDPQELAGMKKLEGNCSQQLSVVNDIYSFEKELIQSESGHVEGSYLCNAVKILADGAGLTYDGAKRVLWVMTREWEVEHDELVAEKKAAGVSQAGKDYMKGLEYQMSGNEQWSRTTPRYHQVE